MYQQLTEKLLQPTCVNFNCRRIGLEVERIPFDDSTNTQVSYDKMKLFLEKLSKLTSWPRIENDKGDILGFDSPFGKLSLEPGSQFELSSPPMKSVEEIKKHWEAFNKVIDPIRKEMGFSWLPMALNPINKIEDIKIIPAVRYDIMTEYLKNRGRLSLWMMRLTASIQLNFDYQNEAEAIDMLKAALILTPFSYALFGNSPMYQGKPSGFNSYRGQIWRENDPDRSGLLPEAFAPGFGFAEYAKLAVNRPLMFAQDQSGKYVAANGKSLHDISTGAIPGVVVDENNAMNSLRELFFETRLKQGYIEIRCIDYIPEPALYGAIAFWMGMLYSKDNRDFIFDYFKNQTTEERQALWVETSKRGLNSIFEDGSIKPFLASLVCLAEKGLKTFGENEARFLQPLKDKLSGGKKKDVRTLSC